MPVLLSLRSSIEGDVDSVKNTFSSWDSCMSQAYCKWPAIVAIIIGSLIVLSIVWCCARCLCCGVECCCGCLSCFNRCCPSPRNKNNGYQQQPQQYPPHTQYQSPAPPMYMGGGGGGYRGPQTATFDAPSGTKYNEDSLPAMPSWQTAQSRRVEEEQQELEMEKLDQQSPQQQNLLHHTTADADYDHYNGDVGAMQAGPYGDYAQHQDSNAQAGSYAGYSQQQRSPTHARPYNDYSNNAQDTAYTGYSQQRQYSNSYSQDERYIGSPVSTAAPSIYPPTYHTQSVSPLYDSQPTNQYGGAPPTYRTAPPTIASPPQQHARMPSAGSYAIGRKPVSGTWRDE